MRRNSRGATAAERITLICSAAVLIAIMVTAGWTAIQTVGKPAEIEAVAHVDRVRVVGVGYYVPITITNRGGATAQDVSITAELTASDGTTETADITINFLAGGEQETAEAIFRTDPSQGELTVSVTSYLHP